MTRIMQAGWETGDVNQIGAVANTGGSYSAPTVVTSTPSPRSGTYCLKCGLASSTTGTGYTRMTIAHPSTTELYWAFGFCRSNALDTATTPTQLLMHTTDTAGNVNFFLSCESDGILRAYVTTAGGSSATTNILIGTSVSTLANETWYMIEVHATAATGSIGNFEVRVNGATVIGPFTGTQRTCQTNANFGAVYLEYYVRGGKNGVVSWFAFDDFRVNNISGSVNNSWPGDEAIRIMVPTSAGDSTQFSRGGVDSGANWSQVDDIPPNGTTDYVYDSVSGHLDLYNTTDFPVQSISAINVIGQVMNSDGAGGQLYLPTKTGAGQSDGSAVSLTGTPTYQNRLLETDPADSGTWTQTKLAALQVGVKVV